MDLTKNNTGLNLILALNYGSRQEIIDSVINISKKNKKERLIFNQLMKFIFIIFNTKNIPDPDLLIRTSGELRISNFLLWQCAYTEMYLTNTYWPDLEKKII